LHGFAGQTNRVDLERRAAIRKFIFPENNHARKRKEKDVQYLVISIR